MQVNFSPPDISDEEILEVTDTLRSGWLTTGPKTKELERRFSKYCQTKKFVCLNSATAAMELILRLLCVGEGDEVITSAYTYTASASVICHVGAKPVIVDTKPGSFEISPDAIEAALSEKTKVIAPVDFGGIVCDYDAMLRLLAANAHLYRPRNELQEAFGRAIISSDSAHSFGSTRDGKISGSLADFSSFSFHAIKNLAMGEGGGLTWRPIPGVDDEALYKQFMLLSLHGQTKDALSKTKLGSWEYDILFPGYKCNLTDIMSSIGLVQLKRYSEFLAKRQHIAEIYESYFSKNSRLWTLQHQGDNFSSNYHLFIVRILDADEEYRNKVITAMAEKGIATNVHFKPLPLLSAYKNLGFDIADCPNAYDMYKNAISLPIHTRLTDEEAHYVAQSLCEIVQ